MKKVFKRRSISLILVVAILATMIGSVFAYDLGPGYTAPTSIMTVDESVLSGATAAANTPVLSILGINVTSTDAAGVLNAASDTSVPMNLQIFGSDWNTNPDPYLWNFYYNLGTQTTGADGAYDLTENANWKGIYTLINNAKSGPSGGVNNEDTTLIKVDGLEEKDCNIIFYYEPDVLLAGSAGAYDVGLTYYQDNENDEYDPLIVDGWATNGDKAYCLNDGTFASTVAMANGVYTEAKEIESETSEKGRYGSVMDCGITYSNFALGIYYYAQSLLESETLTPVKYCTDLSISGTGENVTYTISYSSSRMSQYADGLGELISSSDAIGLEDLKKEVDVVISSDLEADQVQILRDAGIKVLDALPETVYGTFAQAPDNILGLPYVFAYFYSDQLEKLGITLTTADVTAYFVENIYHVKSGNVQDALNLMMYDINDPAVTKEFTLGYKNVITNMIAAGKDCYVANYKGSGYWLAVDEGKF